MSVNLTIPPVDAELVEALQRSFPNKLPGRKADIEDLRFLQGQQHVISWLVRHHEEQQQDSVTDNEVQINVSSKDPED